MVSFSWPLYLNTFTVADEESEGQTSVVNCFGSKFGHHFPFLFIYFFFFFLVRTSYMEYLTARIRIYNSLCKQS